MTILAIAAQDIRAIELALIEEGIVTQQTHVSVPPEQYLATLDRVLTDWQQGLGGIDAIALVTGPGSFTASRVSTTLGNALAFAKNLPVYALENAARMPLAELLASIDWKTHPTQPFALPVYDRPPHITAPTRGDNPLD